MRNAENATTEPSSETSMNRSSIKREKQEKEEKGWIVRY